jgi:hypothetical protein
MQTTAVLTCPKCESAVRVAPLGFPLENEAGDEAASRVLKRCPRCRTWSWMSLARQGTT